jgi:hypothetical protein
MGEAVAVAVVLALVLALGWLAPLPLLAVGMGVAAVGLAASLVAGALYHARLRAEVLRRRPLPARWWWAPSRLHGQLDDAGRRSVLRPYRAGVVLVAFAGGGLLLIAVAAVKAYLEARA